MKTVYTIFFSPTHTSQIIADVIAESLEAENEIQIDLTHGIPENKEKINGGWAVIAFPVYGGRIAETAVERFKQIRANGTKAIICVVYGNRDYDDALVELQDLATAQGFIPVTAGAFIGEHSYSRPRRGIAENRPDKNDIDIAFSFGEKSAKKMTELQDIPPVLLIKGQRPYKEKGPKTPQAPITNEALCTQCGHCIDLCPTYAISLGDALITDANTCIKCCACVKECPNEARIFETPYTDLLHSKCNERREPELFYAQ